MKSNNMLLMIIIIAIVFICISEIRQLNTINNATNNATNIQEKFIIDPDSDTGQIDLSFLKDEPIEKETREQHEKNGGFPEKYRYEMINPPALANCDECKCQGPKYIGCDYVKGKPGKNPSKSNLMVCRKKNGKIARKVRCCGNKTTQTYRWSTKKWECRRWFQLFAGTKPLCIWPIWKRVYHSGKYRGWDGEGICENPTAFNKYLKKKIK